MMKKVTSFVVAVGMSMTMISGSFNNYLSQNLNESAIITAEAATGDKRYINQWALSDYELKTASCFECSLVNGIFYASNGKIKIPVKDIRYICDKSGAWSAAEGTYRNPMITYLDNSGFDDKYGFEISKGTYTTVSDKDVKKWLSSGREYVIIAHIKGHFIALLGYDAKTNKFLVSDSVVYTGSKGRNLPAFGWVSESKLKSGTTRVDWVCKLKYTGSSTIDGAAKAALSTIKKTNTVKKFSKYTGKSGSIVTALKAIHAQSSFEYRKRIYNINPDLVKKYGKTYKGSAAQNTAMLNKLKKGCLIKP